MINLECTAVLQIPTLVPTVAREISINEGEVGCKGWRAIKSDACLDERQPKASDNLEPCPHTVQHSQGASCRYWGSCGCFYLGLCNWGSINWRRECEGGEHVQVSAEQKPTEGDTGGFICADIFSYPLFSWLFVDLTTVRHSGSPLDRYVTPSICFGTFFFFPSSDPALGMNISGHLQ